MRAPLLCLLPTLALAACLPLDSTADKGCAERTWYRDQDGDRFGDPAASESNCGQPDGFVANAEDCDDEDPGVNPKGTEVCDSINADEDCDGQSDLDDDSLVLTAFYEDADGDGYGNDRAEQLACEAPLGFVEDAGDCDDDNSGIHPGATELCLGAGIDEDCDGEIDDEDPGLDTTGLPASYVDADGDGYGTGDAVYVCDRSAYAAVDGDCDETEPTVNPGETEACGDGLDNNCDGDDNGCTLEGEFTADDGTVIVRGETSDKAGGAVSAGGDLTGDGIEDIVLGVTDAGTYGEAWVFAGPLVGELDPNDAYATVVGSGSGSKGVGETVIGGHDWNGDGDADLMVAQADYGTADGLGAVYILAGPLRGSESVSGASRTYRGTVSNGYLGVISTAGDFNGDGVSDLVSSQYVTSGREGYALLYLDQGPVGGGSASMAASAEATITASDYLTHIDRGDVDGDGLDELAVGSDYLDSYTGRAWLFEGAGLSGALDADADAVMRVEGGAPDDRMGAAVTLCDIDGDGAREFVVAAPHKGVDASGSGVVYVFGAPLSGRVTSSAAIASTWGVESGDTLGYELACLGDADGNGTEDLIASAETADGAYANAGVAYVFLDGLSGGFRADSAPAIITGTAQSDQLRAVGPIGDLGGDGNPELYVGALYADTGATDAGYVSIFSAGGI